MADVPNGGSPRDSFLLVMAVLGMLALPAALTLHTARVPAVVDVAVTNPSPYGYTVSLLLFIVPIIVIAFWFVPREGVRISKRSFVRTIGLLFPLGVILDFFFAHVFLTFPRPGATLGIPAPALHGSVPIEEYIFYLTGFTAMLLMYIWFDNYWLAAYSVPGDSPQRTDFAKLIRFHPMSLIITVLLIGAAIVYKRFVAHETAGFPGYFTFLVIAGMGPSIVLFPSALPVVNWRAFSLTLFILLLTSLLWEATLAVPYGWWGYQPEQMMGLRITAWGYLPIEAVVVWIAVCYQTVIVYEVIKRWQGSGRRARHAFLGGGKASA
jgi:hypothetical protein